MAKKAWSLFKSLGHALYGIYVAFRDEQNMRIHGYVTLVVVCALIFFRVTGTELLLILLNCTLVWVAELVNTAIEESFDIHQKENHPQVKVGKDIAAGAVLVASINALVSGLVVFIPKVLLFLR